MRWFGTNTDITAQKQAEQALLRSEKLASVGRMAATIAHEINNPLEAVTNMLFLAKAVKDLPESARQYLEMADAELKRIAHITRQSLGFYRESNAPALTSVNAVLESAVDLLKSKIKAKQRRDREAMGRGRGGHRRGWRTATGLFQSPGQQPGRHRRERHHQVAGVYWRSL